MSPETLRKDLSLVISKLLRHAAEESAFAFLGPNPEARLLGLEDKGKSIVATIASDGLALDQKILLEQYITSSIPAEFPIVTIYYKRLKALTDRIQNPQTADVDSNAKKPFGVNQKIKAIPGVKRIIAVSSGKGGVGKSTVSVNLAVGLAMEGRKVGLLDADLYGPSAAMLMGLMGPMPVGPNQRMIPLEKYGVKVVSFGFMTDPYTPVIWRGPMITKALEQLFYQVEWGELDELIIDLPPGTGDVQLTMIESLPLFGGIVVSTPQAIALLDAHKGLSMFQKLKVPILGLVENMAHFQCGVCGHLEDIFGQEQIEQFSLERSVPIIARIPLNRRIREASDQGHPVVLSDPACGHYYRPMIEAVMDYADKASNLSTDVK
ncbi:MAG: ATP-binding protein [Proteobacteria bacterium]|nr:MAG: ATP-binding protein [Pseudomonadota bacterium]